MRIFIYLMCLTTCVLSQVKRGDSIDINTLNGNNINGIVEIVAQNTIYIKTQSGGVVLNVKDLNLKDSKKIFGPSNQHVKELVYKEDQALVAETKQKVIKRGSYKKR